MNSQAVPITRKTKLVTFKRIQPGVFDVLIDGGPSRYEIINGSSGTTGKGPNIYGIVLPSGIRWIGSLHSAKNIITFWINK